MNKTKHRPTPPRTTHRPARSGRRLSSSQIDKKGEAISIGELLPLLGKGMGLGVGIALAVGVGLLLLGAFVLMLLADPDSAMAPISLVILLFCSLLCGCMISRTVGHRALICGMCGGAAMLILLFLLSFLTAGQAPVFAASTAVWLRVAVVLFSLLGAFLGVNLPRKR